MMDHVTESRFYMWRTLFALVHADGVASDNEVRFAAEVLEDNPFSDVQRVVLEGDISDPKDIREMFAGITDPVDQSEFFRYAQTMVHADGDYGEEEQAVLLELQEEHLKQTNVDDLVGSVNLSFEDDED